MSIKLKHFATKKIMSEYTCTRCNITFGSSQLKNGGCPNCNSLQHMFTTVKNPTKSTPTSTSTTFFQRVLSETQNEIPVQPVVEAKGGSADAAMSFGSVLKDAGYAREELTHQLESALERFSSTAHLERLRGILTKTTRILVELGEKIEEKINSFEPGSRDGPAAPAPTAPNSSVLDNLLRSNSAGQSPVSAQFVDHQNRSALSSPASSQPSSFTETPVNGNAYQAAHNGMMEPEEDATAALGKIRVPNKGDPKRPVVTKLDRLRVSFPFLNPRTTPERLQTYVQSLGFEIVHMDVFKWSDGKTRGTITITLRTAQQARDLLTRPEMELDDWILAPKLVIDYPVGTDPTVDVKERLEEAKKEKVQKAPQAAQSKNAKASAQIKKSDGQEREESHPMSAQNLALHQRIRDSLIAPNWISATHEIEDRLSSLFIQQEENAVSADDLQ